MIETLVSEMHGTAIPMRKVQKSVGIAIGWQGPGVNMFNGITCNLVGNLESLL